MSKNTAIGVGCIVAGLCSALAAWQGFSKDTSTLTKPLSSAVADGSIHTPLEPNDAEVPDIQQAVPAPLAFYSSGHDDYTQSESVHDDLSIEAQAVLHEARTNDLSAEGTVKVPPGMLVIPVKGISANDIQNSWGDRRSGGRFHEGIDILAPSGTEVYAATGGVVVFASYRPLGGNAILIRGADGRRYYYAHLSGFDAKLVVGQTVEAGTRIGFVGKTGNAMHTEPHLHFGIYNQTVAINPYPLLMHSAVSYDSLAFGVNPETSTAIGSVVTAGNGSVSEGLYAQLQHLMEQ